MKNIVILLITLFVFGCKSQNMKSDSDKVLKDGFISYNFKVNADQKELSNELEKMYEEAETKEDSLMVKGLIAGSLKALNKFKDLSFEENYFFINDTVIINTVEQETIFIPKTFTKYVDWKKGRFKRKYISKMDSLYKTWDTSYDIKVDKNDKKIINNIEGYKLIITETRIGSYDTYVNISELYVSDLYKFPFNHYDFLKLKRKSNLSGLILECKSYLIETPNLFNSHTLKEFNTSKQKSNLIDLSKFDSVE
ncbi:hypothetical protein [Polaribacter cellanae]|uniref:Uncharacterized protein n=1 Tax=Polaribacter cellanae TaxID=2818493 RepID=A0A975CRH8_9FLAO|nr:hypothetical protein [Polaribacter cellanae]QTE24353.1 hypothetical protein J3359_08855 [Polaribacter cellanae]